MKWMENNLYDVVIVGGPAGSSAANELAKNGYRTLLVEKHSLPREKSCSGILIKKSTELVHSYFGEEVPDTVKCKPYVSKGMVFTDEMGEEFRFEQAGLIDAYREYSYDIRNYMIRQWYLVADLAPKFHYLRL